jgi:hypothetical protein
MPRVSQLLGTPQPRSSTASHPRHRVSLADEHGGGRSGLAGEHRPKAHPNRRVRSRGRRCSSAQDSLHGSTLALVPQFELRQLRPWSLFDRLGERTRGLPRRCFRTQPDSGWEPTTAANSTHLGQYGCRQTRSLGAYPGATPTQRNPGLAGLFESRMRLYGLRSNPEPRRGPEQPLSPSSC